MIDHHQLYKIKYKLYDRNDNDQSYAIYYLQHIVRIDVVIPSFFFFPRFEVHALSRFSVFLTEFGCPAYNI